MCTYQSICYWVKVNEDTTQKRYMNFRSGLKKKLFQDDDLFVMMLKGLKLSQIILTYVTILPAKFDFEHYRRWREMVEEKKKMQNNLDP